MTRPDWILAACVALVFWFGIVIGNNVNRWLIIRGMEEAARAGWTVKQFYEFWFDRKIKG